jgi:FkbM family methyltransferase
MTTPFEILKKNSLPMPLTIIQVGASGGQELQQFIEAGITDALLIEPLDMPFEILKARTANLSNYLPLKALIHARNGIEINFNVASNGGMSSSILEPLAHLSMYPEITFSEKIALTSYRLDSVVTHLFNESKIRNKYAEMLYLDVQGGELFVLKGAGELLEDVKYIWTEIGLGDGYKGAAKYLDIIHFLANYQFQMIFMECQPGGFGDALFIKQQR